MYGALLGDLIGSPWEFNRIKTMNFPLFSKACAYTDDTIMTVAIAASLLDGIDPAVSMRRFATQFSPQRGGYGMIFYAWLNNPDDEPYGSFGNGGAMRVSPTAMLSNTVDQVLQDAKRVTECTHDHPEGLSAALATAHAIWLAKTGASQQDIRKELEAKYSYDLSRPYALIQELCVHSEHAIPSVPEAISCALLSTSFEDCMRKVVGLGGDADTQAAIAGPIAEMLHGIPNNFLVEMRMRIPAEMLIFVDRLYDRRN